MNGRDVPKEEVVSLGKRIYNERLRAEVERDHLGKFIVVDVFSGDFEIGSDDLDASLRMLDRRPDALLYGVRIGDEVAYRFGSRKIATQQ
jgi:hypothetical protein